MGALSACTSAHQRGVSDVCELPCGCWESNSGPSEEQWVLLTLSHPSSPALSFLHSLLHYSLSLRGDCRNVLLKVESSAFLHSACSGQPWVCTHPCSLQREESLTKDENSIEDVAFETTSHVGLCIHLTCLLVRARISHWFIGYLSFFCELPFQTFHLFFFLVLLKLSFEKSVLQVFSSLIQGHSKLQLLFKNRFLILIRWYLSFPLMVYILTSNYSLPWSHKKTLFYIVF